jgi:cytochrome c oxidase subunit IV
MNVRTRQLLTSYLLLLILLAVECAVAKLPLGEAGRGIVLVSALIMAGIVAIGFMELGKGPQTARFFALAGVVWLAILLGLGCLDPLTRVLYPTQSTTTRSGLQS